MERVSRRRLLAAGGSAAIASAVIGGGVAAAQATRPPGQPLLNWLERYILVLDPARSGTARTAADRNNVPTGPAYFTGTLYKDGDVGPSGPNAGAGSVGTARLSVWVYAGGTNPASVGIGTIDLAARGKITLAGGGGPAGSFAVTGGTGEFSKAGGEARVAYLTGSNAAQTIIELDMVPDSVGR
jgi:hypothetical protein